MSEATPRPRGAIAVVRALGATLIGIVISRAELASLELSDLRMQLTRWIVMALIVAVLALLALSSLSMLVMVLAWDTWRWQAAALLAMFYAALTLWVGMTLKGEVQDAPPLLADTLAELAKDRAALQRDTRKSAGDPDA